MKHLFPVFIDDVIQNWREESIKTRIETFWLKHSRSPFINWREESIKTRIETFQPLSTPFQAQDWREESIKTRIETSYALAYSLCKGCIEEKNPLKQGLKHASDSLVRDIVSNWREESIKTRIETMYRDSDELHEG